VRSATGLTAATFLLGACSTEDLASRSPDMMQFAMRYTEAWCSQDPVKVASFFAEKGSLKINDGEPSVGRAEITAAARSFMTAFPDMVVEMNRLDRVGTQYRYHWTLKGTNTGPGGTGRKVKISGFEEWTIGTDGLIAASLGHFDAADYARQLGE
jgi:predicted ester cyclase